MKVRTANFADITQIVIFAKTQHAKSSFAEWEFNPAKFRRSLRDVIRGANGDVLLAVNDKGQIRGLLMVWHESLTWCNKNYATDLHFVAEQGGDMLLREFKRWAKERNCIEIGMGTFNGQQEDRIEKLYNRLGFETVGKTYRMRLI